LNPRPKILRCWDYMRSLVFGFSRFPPDRQDGKPTIPRTLTVIPRAGVTAILCNMTPHICFRRFHRTETMGGRLQLGSYCCGVVELVVFGKYGFCNIVNGLAAIPGMPLELCDPRRIQVAPRSHYPCNYNRKLRFVNKECRARCALPDLHLVPKRKSTTLQHPLLLPLPVAILLRRTLVMCFFALRKAKLQLHAPLFPVQ